MSSGSLNVDELEPGDCLFHPQQELFYVVTGRDGGHVHFAIHGWRSIGTERLEHYLRVDDEDQFLYTEDELREIVDDENALERLDRLKDMVFTVYADSDKYSDEATGFDFNDNEQEEES